MTTFTREDLGIQDLPEGPLTRWDVGELFGVTIHHFGIPRAGDTVTENKRLVLSVDNSHEQGEYIDIAYNWLFDEFGNLYEGRGWNFQTGGNGTTFANAHYLAFCYIGNSDLDGWPEKAQDAAARLIKRAFEKGVGRVVVPHSHWVSTGCPGDKATAWVKSGAWKADLPDAKQIQFFLMDDAEVRDKSDKVPLGQKDSMWDHFRNRTHERALRLMLQEGKAGKIAYTTKIT